MGFGAVLALQDGVDWVGSQRLIRDSPGCRMSSGAKQIGSGAANLEQKSDIHSVALTTTDAGWQHGHHTAGDIMGCQ